MNIASRKRSAIKALSWRALATLATGGIAYIFIGSIDVAIKISFVDVVFKLILYYFHERVWNLTDWGRK